MEPSRKTEARLIQENQSLRARVAELERHVPRDDERKYHHLFENLNDAAFLADSQTGEILETN